MFASAGLPHAHKRRTHARSAPSRPLPPSSTQHHRHHTDTTAEPHHVRLRLRRLRRLPLAAASRVSPTRQAAQARHHPYAAHLHPFYHIENLARIALDAGHGSDQDAFDPEVVETDRGYLITALVPGVAAGDISVTAAPAEAGEADRLLVRSATRPHIRADLRLPSGGLVDADNITASCIDGVFRVVVPKAEPALETVEIAAGDAPAEAPATPPGAAVFRLDVPGFARATCASPSSAVRASS